jgi:3-deoxy-manno-octulosonate cytidylyltransferase (CMP-KDO synthetase)
VPVAVPPEQTARPPFPHSIVVIPARYESSRFPGKALAPIDGRPMVEHVYRRAEASGVGEVIVATDDERIARAVERFGGRVQMTRATHRTGTERLAEVAAMLRCDVVVNVQGDEPLVEPGMIREAVAPFASDAALQMTTLRRALTVPGDFTSPHVVKVVVDRADFALYFSRAPIPFAREAGAAAMRRHVGLYGYRRDTLLRLAELPPTPLERSEGLEQLRALEHGVRIRVIDCEHAGFGVDTPEDLARAEALLSARASAPAPTRLAAAGEPDPRMAHRST